MGTSDIGTFELGDDDDSRTIQQVYHASDPIPTANMVKFKHTAAAAAHNSTLVESVDLRDRASADVGSQPSEGQS